MSFIFVVAYLTLCDFNTDLVQTLPTEKQCIQRGRHGGKYVCCAGFFEKGGKCTECPIGTESVLNGTCTPCKYPWYGNKCLYQCKCSGIDRCHHVEGCMDTTIASQITSVSSKVTYVKSEITDTPPVLSTTTYIASTLKEVTYLPEPAGKYWIIVGVPCGIIVISGTVIVSIIISILKTRRMGHAEILLTEIHNTNATAGTENMYDEIDEAMMDDLHTSPPANHKQNVQLLEGTNSNGSRSTDTCACEASDGYLNPYTPLAEDWQKHTHVYNDCDDLDEDVETRGYLNPYQPLTNEWQNHTHVYDHGSNKGSDQDK